MSSVTAKAVDWTETGLVPDSVIRAGIRRLLERKLKEIHAGDVEKAAIIKNRFVQMMGESPIALVPHLANEQHYEVPAAFFSEVLGRNRKYSCCYWPTGIEDLESAEEAALQATVERAGIEDG
ncbi:MAG: class I SAM-dependent methyltransferase, partial [Gammaproteobacteria bacterium]|nr:class I SAM-dependent methyltransferase [Gammaproteobacteria bacterium]